MSQGNLSRRNLLRGALALGGSGFVLAATGGEVIAASSQLASKNTPVPFTNLFRRPPVLMPSERGEDEQGKFAKYRITQKLGRQSIVPGLLTTVAGFNGTFPGPTLRIPQGTRSEVRMANALPAISPLHGKVNSTVTHLHGSASLPQYDGYANDQTPPGCVKTYKYPNWQQARTLWYHDHNHTTTAQNVFSGLAAQYHLSDPYERAQLPQGEVSSHMWKSNAIAERMASSSCSRRVNASPPAAQIRCTRAWLPELGTPAVYESQKAGMVFRPGRF